MSVSMDKDSAGGGEDARSVLASWLDDYAAGRCDRTDMEASFLSVCRSNVEAPWDALALLDQYQRRGRIEPALARALKTDIAQLVFGVANQTNEPRDRTEATLDTSGSRWRKLIAEQPPEPDNAAQPPAESAREPASEPTRLRRELGSLDVPLAAASSPPSVSRGPTFQERAAASQPRQESRAPEPVAAEEVPLREIHPLTRPPQSERRNGSGSQRAIPASGVLRGRYELLSVLGRGTSGSVYRALDRHRAHLTENDRCVAVKVLKLNYDDRPESLGELEREFHQAQSLSHPNIVSSFDLDRDGATYFVVRELLEGELLADLLRRLERRPLERDRALSIIGSIGAALAHAHRRNIVHADLKPRNVMITYAGEIKVLDFGFSHRQSNEPWISDSPHGDAVLAPAYASAERVRGEPPQPADDVYSLACIAYELLSGNHPYGGRSAALAKAHGRAAQRIAKLSHKQWQGLQRALRWDAAERQIDVMELLDALGCAEAARVLTPPHELVPVTGGAGVWLRWATLTAIMVAVVSGLVFAYVSVRKAPSSAPNVTPNVTLAPSQTKDGTNDGQESALDTTSPATPVGASPVSAPVASSTPPVSAPKADGPAAAVVQPPSLEPRAVTKSPSAQQIPTEPGAANSAAATQVNPLNSNATPGASSKPPTISFDKDTYVVTESDGAARLTVKRQGSIQKEIKFRWSLQGNSAVQGDDFAAIGPDIETIPTGVRSVTLTIPLVSDAVSENTELFLVELEAVAGGPAIGELARAAVIVVDDD
jgi:serine/threonine protein kinase